METKTVAIGPAFRFGWDSIKKDFWYFVGLAVISIVLGSISGKDGLDGAALSLVGFLLNIWISCGMLWLTISYARENKLPILDIFRQGKHFWRMLGTVLLTGLIFVLGLILFIIPGIYWIMKYQFAAYFVVDKNMGVREAMRKSGEITKGIKWRLLVFTLSSLGVGILGVLALGVGILVAVPIIWLAYAHLYNSLLSQEEEGRPGLEIENK